jgi:predicted DCC family thiol-disulfide oxidoreductase YuxK
MTHLQKLTLFYDGACPLCRAEIQFLSRRNQQGLLAFVDINSEHYRPELLGVSCEQALAAMYAQYEDGKLISGVEVFSAAYTRANLKVLAWIFSRKSLRPVLNASYRFFAKNRHAISKICGPIALWLVQSNNKK